MLSIRKFLVFLSIILIALCVYYSKNFKLDASSDTLILKNDNTYKFYEYYNTIFPSKNFLVLAIKTKNVIDKKYIKNINILKNKINQVEGVESTFSIVDAPILLLNNLTLSNLSNQEIQNINNSDNNLNSILDEFSNSPIFKDQIINSKKNISSIIIYIEKNELYENLKKERNKKNIDSINFKKIDKNYKLEKYKNNIKKEKLILDIRNTLTNQNNNYQYFLGGIDMIASDTINFIKNDIVIFSFAVLFFIILVLFFIYRNMKWVIIPLLTTIYSVILMTGLIGLLNWEITAISSNFISLMLILSISMNIHIINNYRINYFNNKIKNKLKHTIQDMFWPCFYTVLTTIVAFGSLLFSNIKPIIDFGNIMIISLLFIFITSFTILPLLIYSFPKIHVHQNLKFLILNKFCQLSIEKTNMILIINLSIFIISIFGIYKLDVENSFINYFKSNTEIYKGMKLIDTELGGTTPLDILVKFKEDQINITNNNINLDGDLDLEEGLELGEDIFTKNLNQDIWLTEDKLDTINKIHKFLESRNEIGKVQSLNSLIEMANLINRNPLNFFELSILYNEIPLRFKESLIYPYLSIDNNMVKITARIRDSNNIERDKLIGKINNYIKSEFDNIEEFKVNGLLVLYNNMLQSLFSSQIKSFGIILISIFIMFLILFKSLSLSIIGIIPNVFASSFILGLIGLLRIPLDIMTITIAAITIGIAVDNTIHYIYRIKENKKNDNEIYDLIKNTHNNVGYAVLTTSLTIAFGFSILSLSNFVPTILFGLFTALAMIIAMIGVLITLPAILNKFKI